VQFNQQQSPTTSTIQGIEIDRNLEQYEKDSGLILFNVEFALKTTGQMFL
jgi:hypothetical protein